MKNKFLSIIFFFVILGVLRVGFFEVYQIEQNSMKNTYQSGDRVLILKNFFSFKQNKIFIFKNGDKYLIKRCIALPGDIVKIVNGKVFVNDKLVNPPKNYILPQEVKADIFTKAQIFNSYRSDWTPNNFGPYLVPKKGLKIKLSKENIRMYQDLIESNLSSGENIKNDWQKKSSFMFKYDYYFLMGDNRGKSVDSRMFGPVKGTKIRGVVIFKF